MASGIGDAPCKSDAHLTARLFAEVHASAEAAAQRGRKGN
jgi:hypothetical protein